MASVRLYTDRFGGNTQTFNLAEVDLVTGQWYDAEHSGTNQWDYKLTSQAQDTMPTSGDPVWMCTIDIPTRGMNFLRGYPTTTNDPNNFVPLGDYNPIDKNGYWTYPVTEYTERPADWDYAWNTYFTGNQTTYQGKNFWSYSTIIGTSTPAFNPGVPGYKPVSGGRKQFWTYGQGFFSAYNYWRYVNGQVSQWTGNGNASEIASGVAANSYWSVWYQAPGFGSQKLFLADITNRRIDYQVNITTELGSPAKGRIMTCFVGFTTEVDVTTTDEEGQTVTEKQPKNFIGLCCVLLSADGVPQNARIVGLSLEFWQPEGQVGNWGPDSGVEGGDGTFTAPSDTRGDTAGSVANDEANKKNTARSGTGVFGPGGMMHLYSMTAQQLNWFAGQLYADDYWERFKESAFNPVSAILALHTIPGEFWTSASGTDAVHAAGYEFPQDIAAGSGGPPYYHNNSIAWHNVGTIYVQEYSASFADYAPYTQMNLHLPFCGTISIDPNCCMGGWLNVAYTCDLVNGNVAAYVTTCDRNGNTYVKYCATGNCADSFPLFSENQSGQALEKLTGQALGIGASTVGLVGAAVMGSVPGMIATGTALAGQMAAAGWNKYKYDKGIVDHSPQVTGAVSGNAAIVADSQCYLEIIRPQWSNPARYDTLIGIPSDVSGTINGSDDFTGAFTGYLKCRSVDLKGIVGATDEELAEIESTMCAGFHIS